MAPDVKAPPRADPPRKDQPPRAEAAATDPVGRLRTILFGKERDALRRLEKKIDDPAGLAPVVERALTASVRRDPRPLADALFPVMGPAIRRAISQALAGMLQSVNQTLEHTFSWQGFLWRWEAVRTGTSFGEVVLRHTLRYRVEQVFLVHREAGLLLQHVTAPSVAAPAADMVAGMLTAINDFARDSFSIGQGDTLESIQLGEFTLWLEQGGRAVLAAAIRGHAPVEYRADLQTAIEAIEAEHGEELSPFNGDTAPFARSRPRMEGLLQAEANSPRREGHRPWRSWLLLGGILALLGVYGVPALLRERHWERAMTALRSTPGIVVTRANREGGRFLVEGLRDPLAANPDSLMAAAGLDSTRVRFRWEPYFALTPGFMSQRAAHQLGAPALVAVRVVGDTLVLHGAAPEEWWSRARALAPMIPGTTTLREERLPAEAIPPYQQRIARLAALRIHFGSGVTSLDSTAHVTLDSLAAEIAFLDSLARRDGLRLDVILTGSADDIGTLSTNQYLRRERAASVRAALSGRLPTLLGIELAEAPEVDGTVSRTEEERARSRAVWAGVRLSYPGAASETPAP